MSRTIETERLLLRQLEVADVSVEYVAWLNDPEVSRYLETRHAPQDEETVRTFVERVRSREDEVLFGIFLKDAGRHIGNIKVGPVRPYHQLADISLFIGPRDCWGRGYRCGEPLRLRRTRRAEAQRQHVFAECREHARLSPRRLS